MILDLVRSEKEDDLIGHLGPDLLGSNWTPTSPLSASGPTRPHPLAIGLLEQRDLAGVGNVFRSGLCFLGGIDH